MRRVALVLIVSLVVGASAAFFAHAGVAREQSSQPAAAHLVSFESLPGLVPLRQPAVARQLVARPEPSTISIPRLHLKSRVFPSAELNRGPAWWPITGRPGGGDTVAIAGHRTTHTHPFYYLDRLRLGDAIYVTYHEHAYRYRVDHIHVFSATDLHIADAVGHERLLLSACTPRGSAAFRLVVEARPA